VCRIQACRLGDDNGERLALEDHGNVQGPLDGPAPVAKPLWSTSAGCCLGWEQACVKTSQSEFDDVVLGCDAGRYLSARTRLTGWIRMLLEVKQWHEYC
jgi:hypothetical protein